MRSIQWVKYYTHCSIFWQIRGSICTFLTVWISWTKKYSKVKGLKHLSLLFASCCVSWFVILWPSTKLTEQVPPHHFTREERLSSWNTVFFYNMRPSIKSRNSIILSVIHHHQNSLELIIVFSAVKDFSLIHSIQTGSGTHPASYPVGTGDSFPGGKAAGAWSWSLTSS
jgi:hypothetical protein